MAAFRNIKYCDIYQKMRKLPLIIFSVLAMILSLRITSTVNGNRKATKTMVIINKVRATVLLYDTVRGCSRFKTRFSQRSNCRNIKICLKIIEIITICQVYLVKYSRITNQHYGQRQPNHNRYEDIPIFGQDCSIFLTIHFGKIFPIAYLLQVKVLNQSINVSDILKRFLPYNFCIQPRVELSEIRPTM